MFKLLAGNGFGSDRAATNRHGIEAWKSFHRIRTPSGWPRHLSMQQRERVTNQRSGEADPPESTGKHAMGEHRLLQPQLLFGLGFAILAQILWSAPRLAEPLVDGMAHVDFDNAIFMRHVAHSLDSKLPDARKVFGVASYVYDEEAEPVRVDHYSHHGVLAPFLLTNFSRLVGNSETTVRSFTLAVSLVTTVALGLLIYSELQSPVIATVFALLHAMLPLRATYLDQWKYEIGVECVAIICLAFLSYYRRGGYTLAKYGFLASFALLFHTDYAAFLIAGMLWLSLAIEAHRESDWSLAAAAAIAGITGFVSTAAIQYSLGFDLHEIRNTFLTRTEGGLEGVPLQDVIGRQLLHIDFNYGSAVMLVMISALLYSLMNHQRDRNLCATAGRIFFVTGGLWLLVLRDHSHIHHYAQWWFGSAMVLATAGGIAEFCYANPDSVPTMKRVAIPTGAALLLIVAITSYSSNKSFHEPSFGTEDDIAMIRTSDRPLVVLSNGLSGPVGWWTGPVIKTYTDPVFSNRKNQVSVVPNLRGIDFKNRTVVLLNSQETVNELLREPRQ